MRTPIRSHLAVWSGAVVISIFGGALQDVQAQIYSGVSDSGAIVLSSNLDDVAQTLLIEAERLPSGLELMPPKETTDFAKSVPSGYLPFIREASTAYRVPSELIHAVISVESNYNPNALSPKGARGLMQLMPATAKRFGSNNNADPRQNILTGSRYLRWLLDFFDEDVELALAAYNAGEAAVVQAGHKIPRFSETQRYVPKVLSIYKKAKPLT
jgi:soluble lytic murein transglycosylase-like protein